MGSQPGLTPALKSPTPRAALTEQAAAEFVQNHGCDALTILGERAEMAEELGHRVAAKTWHEMADAAARLLRIKRPDADQPWPATPGTGRHGTVHGAAIARR